MCGTVDHLKVIPCAANEHKGQPPVEHSRTSASRHPSPRRYTSLGVTAVLSEIQQDGPQQRVSTSMATGLSLGGR